MAAVERRYAKVGDRLVHFRCCGTGPAVVLLHDSPRSSRLYIDTMRHLGSRFRVYALDTPGYGNSSSLQIPQPTIDDFGAALGETLAALGLQRAPIYATHTSAKIALAYASANPLAPLLVLDGLSIPTEPPNPAFIDSYMRPFRLDDSGGYLAAEWTRVRDMVRWFPWFDPRPQARMAMAAPGPEWMVDYVIDLFSAGPHYSDAYAAAMYYDPLPALTIVSVPTRIAARADDVLCPCLDLVPASANPQLSVEWLPADRDAWLRWLNITLADGCAFPGDAGQQDLTAADPTGTFYVDLPHGQMRVHRAGPSGTRPLLILDAPTTHHALHWQEAMAQGRATLVPELPGYGESDPLSQPVAEAFADALVAMLEAVGAPPVDVLGIGFAAPLAAILATRHPSRIASVAFDGSPPVDRSLGDAIGERLCPHFAFDPSGALLHQIWHMLRDSEVQWPWFESSLDACRQIPPDFRAAVLHRTLTEILKQPRSYGDAARAALAASGEALYRGVTAPVLLFEHPSDPAYGSAPHLASLLPNAQGVARGAEFAIAARALETFLDRGVQVSSSPVASFPQSAGTQQ